MRTPAVRTPRSVLLALGLFAAAAVGACATNPATGASELMLISEAQEIEMGRQYDQEIVATLGLYPDSGLQRYLQQLGAGIAAQSERPGLPWTFRVVDDPTVNAFAVPGGFVYVTRGIMAHLNSEAQLASVVGHEIGHITARHTARSLSRQQLAQIGLAVGSIASERFAQFADLASTGLGVLFLKFSRDDESQADALGLRYLQRTAFDVREMPGVFDMLEQLSAAAGGAGRVPEWLATHPTPADRRTRIDRAIAALPQDFTGKVVNRDSYERRLDGMVFGADPRQGYFDGTRFLHPGLRFHFTFPAGWATENGAQAVRAMSAEQDAAVELTFAREATAAAASQAFLTQEGIRAGPSQRASFSGLPAVVTPFATTSGDAMQGTVAFVEHGNAVYRLLGFAPAARWAARRAVAEQSLRSFAVLTDPVALDMQPQRVSILTLDRRSTITELAGRRASPVPPAALALLNQTTAETVFAAGGLLKWVVGPALPR
jgi:predicted Zn-dependent protease